MDQGAWNATISRVTKSQNTEDILYCEILMPNVYKHKFLFCYYLRILFAHTLTFIIQNFRARASAAAISFSHFEIF